MMYTLSASSPFIICTDDKIGTLEYLLSLAVIKVRINRSKSFTVNASGSEIKQLSNNSLP